MEPVFLVQINRSIIDAIKGASKGACKESLKKACNEFGICFDGVSNVA